MLVFRDVRREFKEAGLLDNHTHCAWPAINTILNAPARSISEEDFEDLVPRDKERILFRHRVFTHHAAGTVSLQSRAVEHFAREYLVNHDDVRLSV
jgi:hypothetical protein